MQYNSVHTGSEIDSAITKVKQNVWDGQTIEVTLPVAGWSNLSQTIQNDFFIADGYFYLVLGENTASQEVPKIYAQDVTVNGSMTFFSSATISSDQTFNIIRLKGASL